MNEATETARREEPLIIPALAPQGRKELLEISFDHEVAGRILYQPSLVLVLELSNGMTPSVILREESILMLRDYLTESLKIMAAKRANRSSNTALPRVSDNSDYPKRENVHHLNLQDSTESDGDRSDQND